MFSLIFRDHSKYRRLSNTQGIIAYERLFDKYVDYCSANADRPRKKREITFKQPDRKSTGSEAVASGGLAPLFAGDACPVGPSAFRFPLGSADVVSHPGQY